MNFDTGFLVPVIILLGVSVLISVVLSKLKIRVIPTFSVEIIIGIILGVLLNEYFKDQGLESTVDGLYVIGFAMIMFISGFDIDLNVVRDRNPIYKGHINIRIITLILISLVYIAAVIASFFFWDEFTDKIAGIALLTIFFSSTFAGIVAPLVTVDRMYRTGWGNLIITYSFVSELLSIVFLSIYMIVANVSFASLWSYGIIFLVFMLLYFALKIRNRRKFDQGMVFLKTRMVVVALAISVFFSEVGGGEYVLGAFLLGFLLKSLGVKGHYLHTIEQVGYGIFIPMFFMIVGMRIDILHFFRNPELFLTVGIIFLCLLLVRIPFLYLLKWYKLNTVITSIVLSTSTLVVAIAVDHIGVHADIFSFGFGESLILAAVLTSIIGPIFYEMSYIKTIRNVRLAERGITYGKID
jgi:Kef-type K+ transport system membrane component KefB